MPGSSATPTDTSNASGQMEAQTNVWDTHPMMKDKHLCLSFDVTTLSLRDIIRYFQTFPRGLLQELPCGSTKVVGFFLQAKSAGSSL